MILNASRRILFIILTLVSGLGFWGGSVWGQTTVFSDDFNRAILSPGGTPSMTYITALGTNVTSSMNSSTYLSIISGTSSAISYISGPVSTFSTPYNSTLSNNTGTITWTFNFRWNRASTNNPATPASGAYGQAIILASSSSNISAAGTTGYAVVYGNSSTPDPIRLVRFINGVTGTGTLTNICSSGASDIANTNNFASVRVTYEPSTNIWALFVRDDGATAWADPSSGVTSQKGSNTVNSTYTSTPLTHFGFLFTNATTTGQSGDFDNFKVTVSPPSTLNATPTMLSGFNYVTGYGPSASQFYKLNGTNLTPSSGNIAVTGSTNYEVSADNITFGGSASIPYTDGAINNTPVYVRLRIGQPLGNYNEDIGNAGGGVSNFNVTCNGNVTCALILAAPNTPVTENFDGLGNTGTSSWVPCGWSFAETGSSANTTYTSDYGFLNSGETYSYGSVSSTDRALGGLFSGSLVPTIGAQVKNNTGGIINTLSIQYTGEQWRLGTPGREDRLDFQYSLDATSLSTGNWTDVNPLDFIAPISMGTVGALDGNSSLNKGLVTANIFGLTIPNGADFWIRWNDFNATNADDGLAIDDFSITALTPCPLSISDFAPVSGPIGTLVTINGSNFTNITNVQFNGINAVFTVISSTQITATIPAGNTSGFITVINNTPCSVTSSLAFFTISTDCSFTSDLMISEYVEGSSTNKAIEIVNLTGASKSLSGYKLLMYFNGLPGIGNTITLPIGDNIANNATYVVVPSDAASSTLLSKANYTAPASGWFNGDDAIVLMNGSTVVDVFGNIGCDPGTSWTSGSLSTYDHTLVRKSIVFAGISTDPGNPPCSFPSLATEWDQYDVDDFTHLGVHAALAGTPPTISIISPQTVCQGGTAAFSVTASGGVSPYTFVWKVLDNSGFWTTILDGPIYTISGDATTSILGITNSPSGYNNYQYYCEVKNSGNACFTASNAAKLSVINLWLGATPNWETNSNWNCGTSPSTTTNVLIPTSPSGGSMPIINNLISADCRDIEIQSSATLTVQSDATSSGSLIVNGVYSGTGNVFYNRYIENNRWYITSSPVNNSFSLNGSTIGIKDGSYNFAPYDEANNNGWNYVASIPTSLNTGQGYLLKLLTGNTIQYTGAVNPDVTVSITNTATSPANTVFENGWNAIGNPFTSALKITGPDGFITQNISKLETNYNAVYLWYQTGSYTGSEQYYRVINNSGYYSGKEYGGPITEDYVQAGQGFLINAKIQGSSTVTFNHGTSGMQVHSTATTLKKSESSWPGITLLATNNGQTRSTIVAFNEKMTAGLDPSYDAGLLSVSDFNLHTHLVAGGNETSFTIQCLPDTMYGTLSVPVGIDLPQPGMLTFKVAGVILPDGIYPVIEDRLLQSSTPLKSETDSLTVDIAVATRGTGRFYLHFGGTEINTGINTKPEAPELTARYGNRKITISGNPEQGSKAWLYDINGRKLSGEYRLTSENQNEIPVTGLSSGIYLLKIEGKTYRQTLKITILNR